MSTIPLVLHDIPDASEGAYFTGWNMLSGGTFTSMSPYGVIYGTLRSPLLPGPFTGIEARMTVVEGAGMYSACKEGEEGAGGRKILFTIERAASGKLFLRLRIVGLSDSSSNYVHSVRSLNGVRQAVDASAPLPAGVLENGVATFDLRPFSSGWAVFWTNGSGNKIPVVKLRITGEGTSARQTNPIFVNHYTSGNYRCGLVGHDTDGAGFVTVKVRDVNALGLYTPTRTLFSDTFNVANGAYTGAGATLAQDVSLSGSYTGLTIASNQLSITRTSSVPVLVNLPVTVGSDLITKIIGFQYISGEPAFLIGGKRVYINSAISGSARAVSIQSGGSA
jgi:hypothetical protein